MWLKWKYAYDSKWNYYLMGECESKFITELSYEQIRDILSERDIDICNLPSPFRKDGIEFLEYSLVDTIPLEYLQKEIERLDNCIYYDTRQRNIYLQMIQERQYDKS